MLSALCVGEFRYVSDSIDILVSYVEDGTYMQLYKLVRKDLKNNLHRLYRYAPWTLYTIDVITHRHLYLATASQMNDEWEFRIPYVQHNNLVGSLEEMFPTQAV